MPAAAGASVYLQIPDKEHKQADVRKLLVEDDGGGKRGARKLSQVPNKSNCVLQYQ